MLNDGLRPATIVPLDEAALHALSTRTAPSKLSDSSVNAANIVQWLKARDPTLLREKLRTEIVIYGIASFVLNIMPFMNDAVGRAWEKGEVAVRAEHIYSDMMQVLLREALASLLKPAGASRMLLTTLPGE